MLSLFFLVLILTIYYVSLINGCSLPTFANGTYYISRVQLLDVTTTYPDSVLIEIYKARNAPLNHEGPICKIMNINDTSVGDVVKCDDYSELIRDFDVVDTDTTNTMVTCKDNCDGLSATCNIMRNYKPYSIQDIPFLASDTSSNCDPDDSSFTSFASFTINDISTTYILFFFFYSSSNIIRSALGCCTCLSYSLSVYDIENIDYPDPTNGYDQIFSVFSFQTHGGHVDAVKSRVYHWGISSNTVNIYHVSDDSSVQYEPNLEP